MNGGVSKTFIIGGAGFVGSRLTARLRESKKAFLVGDIRCGHEDCIKLDIEDPGTLDEIAGCDSIVNLAAVHRDDIRPLSRYDDVNVQGSVNICMSARKHGIEKLVFTSSVAIYGFAPAGTDESGSPNYFNDYGRTKYLAEQVYKEWQAEDPENRTLVIVRPTVIFGEGNRGNVYSLLKQIASRRFVMFGNGTNKKSMAYVENVAAFLAHSLSFKPGLHIYNYVDTPDIDINTLVSNVRKILFSKNNVGLRLPAFLGMTIGYLADSVAKMTGKTFTVSSVRVKKFMATTQFSSSMSETDFQPPISLDEGLTRTLRYEFQEDNSGERTFETE